MIPPDITTNNVVELEIILTNLQFSFGIVIPPLVEENIIESKPNL